MPKPATLVDLVEMIRASRLVAEPRLQAALARHRGAAAGPPAALLDRLVGEGAFTPFQAAQLAQGRWRGFLLGPYRLLDRLGGGGMGQVYLAAHAATGATVAVKVLGADLAGDPTARARFAREARAAAALDHPNVVRVLEVAPEADPPYLVMEHIDGVSLQAAVARRGTFPAGWAAEVGRQVALGLQCAADAGLVHRDVKPANVLLDRAGRCKLLDLGIVLVGTDAGLTLAAGERTILGTADYLAPEQAVDSSRVDCRADLYALGGTVYFLLAGAPPFPDGPALLKLVAKQFRDPPRLECLRPDLPAGLADVVHRLLARDPADRPATPAAAAAALAPFAVAPPDFVAALFAPGRGPADEPAGADTAGSLGTLDESDGSKTEVIPRGPDAAGSPETAPGPFDDLAAGPPTAVVSRGEIARGFRRPARRRVRPSRAFWRGVGVGLALAAVALAGVAAFRPPPGPPPPGSWSVRHPLARLFGHAPKAPESPGPPARP